MKYQVAVGWMLLIGLTGCFPATAYKMNHINLGMDKQTVIEKIGQPSSSSAKGNIEYLKYVLRDHSGRYFDYMTEYFVRLKEGKVDAYGKVGDFDSTKDPAFNLNIGNTGSMGSNGGAAK